MSVSDLEFLEIVEPNAMDDRDYTNFRLEYRAEGELRVAIFLTLYS